MIGLSDELDMLWEPATATHAEAKRLKLLAITKEVPFKQRLI